MNCVLQWPHLGGSFEAGPKYFIQSQKTVTSQALKQNPSTVIPNCLLLLFLPRTRLLVIIPLCFFVTTSSPLVFLFYSLRNNVAGEIATLPLLPPSPYGFHSIFSAFQRVKMKCPMFSHEFLSVALSRLFS